MARNIPLFLLLLFHLTFADDIATNTPVPPLQWINLTNLLRGNSPPPLKDAAIGYDEVGRSIILFGGESEGGFPQGQTYLLNLDSLTWGVPSPPANLQQTPPARSAALAGEDFAASNRRAFVVVGGKGSDGKPLSDVWAFDFNNQFWSTVFVSSSGPSARWGASGGIDPRVSPSQDPVVPGPNNTFYMAGGTDGVKVFPLSEVWRLHLSGTLSSNLPNSTSGSWDRMTIGSFPARVGDGGTIVGQQLVAMGGCGVAQTNTSCASQDSFVIDVARKSGISPAACPLPRLGPAVTPNFNPFTPSFASQAFVVLGTFNQSLWKDDGSLEKGGIDILDINAGTWTRVIPSGDPGTSGSQTYPSPREGASILSYQMGLVGSSRNSSADTIIFGGRDSSGKYISEVWLLRAYKGSITTSNSQWDGFGNGHLQTGIAADGQGVKIQYLSQCASPITTSTSPVPTPSATRPNPSTSPTKRPVASEDPVYQTSLSHKLLVVLSLIVMQTVIIIFRNPISPAFAYIFTAIGIGGYALGIAGLALAFTTISITPSLEKRSISSLSSLSLLSSPHLRTGHGLAGLVLFVCVYALVPLWTSIATAKYLRGPSRKRRSVSIADVIKEKSEHQTTGPSQSTPQSVHNVSPPSSPRPRTQSWGPSILWRRSVDAGFSSDSDSVTSGIPRAFEVVNRPRRFRQSSGVTAPIEAPRPASRSLGEIDWLLRRRSLNAVGELDYAISQAQNARHSTPGTADILLAPADDPPDFPAELPTVSQICLRLMVHASILGLNVVTLHALWTNASRVFFILFLIWTIAFYVLIFLLAWNYRPSVSTLSTVFYRLRHPPLTHPGSENPSTPLPTSSPTSRLASFPNSGPYIHQPPYRAATTDEYSGSHFGPRSVEADDDDEIDEVTRQRIIEEEMDRREVSIVTVPKRRLWVANPS